MHQTIRQTLIEDGTIKPARDAGDPTPPTESDKPTLRLDASGAKAAAAAIAKPAPAWKAERALLNGAPTLTPWGVERERAA